MKANHLKAYFSFTRKERIGIVTLLGLILFLWLAPSIPNKDEVFDEEGYQLFLNEIEQLSPQSDAATPSKDSVGRSAPRTEKEKFQPALFYFDPNTLSPDDWRRLGIPDKTARVIQNYIAKGGKFYRGTDLRKIYGLSKQDYERLQPYVRIQARETRKHDSERSYQVKDEVNGFPPNILINSADTNAFRSLPGIGEKLSKRIVAYREKLGGFYTVEQVREVYGIKDSVFQLIKPRLQCDTSLIRKININTATLDMLKAHPYIKYQVGNAVIQYRSQHGSFANEEDLVLLHVMSEDLLQKLRPYISY